MDTALNRATAEPAELSALIAQLRESLPTANAILIGGTVGANKISSCAALVARGLASDGTRVVMVELESAAQKLGLVSEGPGLGDLLLGEASFVDVIYRDQGSRLHLIAAGWPLVDQASPDITERVGVIFEALSSTYDAVIFDMGPVEGDLSARAWAPLVAACNLSVIVFDPARPDDLDSARNSLQSLGARHVGEVPIGTGQAAGDGQAAA